MQTKLAQKCKPRKSTFSTALGNSTGSYPAVGLRWAVISNLLTHTPFAPQGPTVKTSYIDIAVLVTGDGDFVPLVRALMKQGIRVAVAYFEYETANHRSLINDRLLTVCNYAININAWERDKKYQPMFKSLFRAKKSKSIDEKTYYDRRAI